jgi:hypothetical protein
MPYEIHEDKIVMRAKQYNLPKPWQGLTDEELFHIGVATGLERAAVEMISNKLKEKNSG